MLKALASFTSPVPINWLRVLCSPWMENVSRQGMLQRLFSDSLCSSQVLQAVGRGGRKQCETALCNDVQAFGVGL